MARKKTNALAPLALAALGVVFGDIGTSPLYAFTQTFGEGTGAGPTPENVLGILSLIVWALITVVCVKYVTFMLRADYEGEGGILALLAQLQPQVKAGMPATLGVLAAIVLFGAAALYGDGVITPAISVISAFEGLDVLGTAAHPYIAPLSAVVLFLLFALQRRGTGSVGRLFGPIMVLWFLAIGVAGAVAIAHHLQVLVALNPVYGIDFFVHNGGKSILIFGAVVLCVTGVEALYADLAHFGRVPIVVAWYVLVFPALLLNYFGQGALALANPASVSNAFYNLFPQQLVLPMVLLATAATVIASQALISGVFSLTQQAMQLGYSPRFRLLHTSRHHAGQVYMPGINWLLAIGCIVLVLTFRSSAALGSAYGLAVTITMITTTIAYTVLIVRRGWRWWQIVPLVALFATWDVPFFAGNIVKVTSGGWLPLSIALVLFALFTTWNRGRRRMITALTAHTLPIENFVVQSQAATTLAGTAIFLTPDQRGIPFVLEHHWLRQHIVFDNVILLTIANVGRPYVSDERRTDVEELHPRLHRVRANFGFMEHARIGVVLRHLHHHHPDVTLDQPTYYLASPKLRRAERGTRLPFWQFATFRWMARNARPLTDSLGLPANHIVEFGVEVKI